MTTCPQIASETDDKIELSTYTRTVGTSVVIGCKGFGRQVKDPTNVICGANGQWSEEPNLECEVKLNDKEKVYVAVAVVCSLIFLFGLCWISAAIFCRRRHRRGWGSRWSDVRQRTYGWFGFGGGRRSHDRVYKSRDRYVSNSFDPDERSSIQHYFQQALRDNLSSKLETGYMVPSNRLLDEDHRLNSEKNNNGYPFEKSERYRDESDKGWLVSRKSDRYNDSVSWKDKKRSDRGSAWEDDKDKFRQNIYYMGVDSREWNRGRPPLYPGESWRYGQYGGGRLRDSGGYGDARMRESSLNRLEGRDRRQGQGQGRYGRNDGYENWDNLDKIPHNDMESIYRLRRKYDRVFDDYHPRIPNQYLPRDSRAAKGTPVGPAWLSNYPVLKLTDRETIYNRFGDPMMRQRRYSDTFVDRQGYRSQRLEGGGGVDGGGLYRSVGEGGGYRRTRRYSDSRLDAVPARRIEYVQDYAPRKVYEVEERRGYNDVMTSSPAYEVITLPSNYMSVDNGPKLVQLGAEQLKIPTYRRSYVQSDAGANTDYFLSRQDFRYDTRKSQKHLDHTLYHGHGRQTEMYEDVSDIGRR